MKKLMIALALIGAFSFISCENKEAVQSGKLNIIFETDIGNDVDDAMALDMIYKYLDQDRSWLISIHRPTSKHI